MAAEWFLHTRTQDQENQNEDQQVGYSHSQAGPNHAPRLEMTPVLTKKEIFSDFQFYFAEQNWDPSFFLQNLRSKLERPGLHHPFWEME